MNVFRFKGGAGSRDQELGFVILSLFCEGSCQSEREDPYELHLRSACPVPAEPSFRRARRLFGRSHPSVGNVARPVPAKPCIEGVIILL